LDGDQPITRPLPVHRTAQKQNKRTQTSMPRLGFEHMIPVFGQAKIVHALTRHHYSLTGNKDKRLDSGFKTVEYKFYPFQQRRVFVRQNLLPGDIRSQLTHLFHLKPAELLYLNTLSHVGPGRLLTNTGFSIGCHTSVLGAFSSALHVNKLIMQRSLDTLC
jgi:hypothetical protein